MRVTDEVKLERESEDYHFIQGLVDDFKDLSFYSERYDKPLETSELKNVIFKHIFLKNFCGG